MEIFIIIVVVVSYLLGYCMKSNSKVISRYNDLYCKYNSKQ